MIDNYDSFTWNLVQPLAAGGAECMVVRNDAATVSEVVDGAFDRVVISPGPFGPDQAGVSADVVRALGSRVPILGVCLGMQVIAMVAGARVEESGSPIHGKQRELHHNGGALYQGVPTPFAAGLYHSLVVVPSTIPPELAVTASTADGVIMGVESRDRPVHGVLFHPESFLTPDGERLLSNFMAVG